MTIESNSEIQFSLPELATVSHQLIHHAKDRRIWLFSGQMGSGKTTLIKHIAEALGIQDQVQSPSYSLINEYHGHNEGQSITLMHMDLYRLNTIEEALEIGIEDYLAGYLGDYCFIEWPELVEEIIPDSCFKLNVQIIDDSTRKVLILS